MNVAEVDPAMESLLREEHSRCLKVLEALQKKVGRYPKGALNLREKKSGKKRYSYYYLVFREGKRVMNKHIPASEVPALQAHLAERNKCRKEIQIYRQRIAFLEKVLRVPGK